LEEQKWGVHPIADVLLHNYIRSMKRQNISPDQIPKTANTQQSTTVAALNQTKTEFKPSPDAVAKKAYFSYLNGGSQPGQEVKHWLEAEAQLFAGIDREMRILPR
jgi:hypothetical protein